MDQPKQHDPQLILAQIDKSARQAREQFSRNSSIEEFGCNQASIRYLDQFIAEYRASARLNPAVSAVYRQAIASFLGACIIEQYGGNWVIKGGPCLEQANTVGGERQADPFAAVGLALAGTLSQSLFDYFYAKLAQEYALPKMPPPSAAMIDKLRHHAEAVIGDFGPHSQLPRFGYNAPTLAWLDTYIENKLKADSSTEFKKSLMNKFAPFVGECIIAVYGGEWSLGGDGRPSIKINKGERDHVLLPYAQLVNRIQNGQQESLHGWFTQKLPAALATPARPIVRGGDRRVGDRRGAATADLPEEMLVSIRDNADMVMQDLELQCFGYKAESIGCIEQYLEDTDTSDPHLQEKLVKQMGAFLGVSTIAVYGGRWQSKPDGKPCVKVYVDGQDVVLDPFAMVARRLTHGKGDNLHAYFTQTLPLVVLPASARMMMLIERRPPRGFFTSLLAKLMVSH